VPGKAGWFFHPDANVDVVIHQININYLREQGFYPDFFTSDEHAVNRDRLREMGVSAGDGVFVLGFPMNLAGVQRNHVIARQGIIARVSEMVDRASQTFMIDASVFPGNSGGPVILKPEAMAIEGTKHQPRAVLVGMVTSYKPYSDIAVSVQTKRPRVIFAENSGLADVLPTDFIEETIGAWRAARDAGREK
jgi:hypothetical protein